MSLAGQLCLYCFLALLLLQLTEKLTQASTKEGERGYFTQNNKLAEEKKPQKQEFQQQDVEGKSPAKSSVEELQQQDVEGKEAAKSQENGVVWDTDLTYGCGQFFFDLLSQHKYHDPSFAPWRVIDGWEWDEEKQIYLTDRPRINYWSNFITDTKTPLHSKPIDEQMLPLNIMWTKLEKEWTQVLHNFEGRGGKGLTISFIPGGSNLDNKDQLPTALQDFQEKARERLRGGTEEMEEEERELLESLDSDIWSWVPKTYILPDQVAQFLDDEPFFNSPIISKPPRRGRSVGVSIHSSGETIDLKATQQMMQAQKDDIKPEKRDPDYYKLILQQYIDNPALYNGHKVSIRALGTVISVDPLIVTLGRIVLVVSFLKYLPNSFNDLFSHISNYHLSVTHPQYEATFYNGSSTYLLFNPEDITRYVKLSHPERNISDDFGTKVLEQIVRKSTFIGKTIQNEYQKTKLKYNDIDFHEHFGIDFMPDVEGNVWLLEFNRSPGICNHRTISSAITLAEIQSCVWNLFQAKKAASVDSQLQCNHHHCDHNDNNNYGDNHFQNNYADHHYCNDNSSINSTEKRKIFKRLFREQTENLQSCGAPNYLIDETADPPYYLTQHIEDYKIKQCHKKDDVLAWLGIDHELTDQEVEVLLTQKRALSSAKPTSLLAARLEKWKQLRATNNRNHKSSSEDEV